MVASLSQLAMVKQHRAIGITVTRCCGYPRRCNLKTDSHPRNGNRITLRTPTLVRWVRCYCQADGFTPTVNPASVTCCVQMPLPVLEVRRKGYKSQVPMAGRVAK